MTGGSLISGNLHIELNHVLGSLRVGEFHVVSCQQSQETGRYDQWTGYDGKIYQKPMGFSSSNHGVNSMVFLYIFPFFQSTEMKVSEKSWGIPSRQVMAPAGGGAPGPGVPEDHPKCCETPRVNDHGKHGPFVDDLSSLFVHLSCLMIYPYLSS